MEPVGFVEDLLSNGPKGRWPLTIIAVQTLHWNWNINLNWTKKIKTSPFRNTTHILVLVAWIFYIWGKGKTIHVQFCLSVLEENGSKVWKRRQGRKWKRVKENDNIEQKNEKDCTVYLCFLKWKRGKSYRWGPSPELPFEVWVGAIIWVKVLTAKRRLWEARSHMNHFSCLSSSLHSLLIEFQRRLCLWLTLKVKLCLTAMTETHSTG